MAAVATMHLKETKVPEPPPQSGLATIPREPLPSTTQLMATIEQHPDWHLLQRLPMRLAVGIPLPHFRVKDLLVLRPGQVLTSAWVNSDDVPVKIGAVQLSWCEFEVVEQRMAIRLTRLA